MSTLVLGDEPAIEQWLTRRRALGQDGRDEVWEGVCHVAPPEHGRNGDVAIQLAVLLFEPARRAGLRSGGSFNLGTPGDFRVPDVGLHRGTSDRLYFPTAALVVEVLSPGDETWATFGLYARSGVGELWVVDPLQHTARCWQLQSGEYVQTSASGLLGLQMTAVVAGVDWP